MKNPPSSCANPPAMRRIFMLGLLLVLGASLLAPDAAADFLWFKIRNPVADAGKITGDRLTAEESAIVDIVMAFYAVKYGYAKNGEPLKDALKKMTDEEYRHAVAQAAKICKSDVAKGFYRMGKGGEKLLKAAIQTIEDAAKAAGDYIEKKSEEFDENKSLKK
jgi:hypothetical protein